MLRYTKRFVAALTLSLMAVSGCSLATSPLGTASHSYAAKSVSQQSVLVMPDMGVTPLLKAIQGAKTSVWLEIYMFTNHDLTETLVQALVERAKAGVDVKVMLESHPFVPNLAPDAPSVNQDTINALTAGGVQVKGSNPEFKYTHEKGMIIDGKTAYIMTCNFTNSAFTTNREYIVADTDPSDVSEVSKIFMADWNRVGYTPEDPELVVSPTNSRAKILKLIDSAKKSILLECEYLTDPEVATHLGNRVKDGVSVRVLLSYQPKDPKTGRDSNAKEKELLASKGVHRVIFPRSIKMHAKSIVVDNTRAFVGSENLTSNSLNNNRELGILVEDPAVLKVLSTTAEKDWQSQ